MHDNCLLVYIIIKIGLQNVEFYNSNLDMQFDFYFKFGAY